MEHHTVLLYAAIRHLGIYCHCCVNCSLKWKQFSLPCPVDLQSNGVTVPSPVWVTLWCCIFSSPDYRSTVRKRVLHSDMNPSLAPFRIITFLFLLRLSALMPMDTVLSVQSWEQHWRVKHKVPLPGQYYEITVLPMPLALRPCRAIVTAIMLQQH